MCSQLPKLANIQLAMAAKLNASTTNNSQASRLAGPREAQVVPTGPARQARSYRPAAFLPAQQAFQYFHGTLEQERPRQGQEGSYTSL